MFNFLQYKKKRASDDSIVLQQIDPLYLLLICSIFTDSFKMKQQQNTGNNQFMKQVY